MLRLALILALLGSVLAGCSGHTTGKNETVMIPASWSINGLTFAYPYDGQQLVATVSPVVLHFSAALTDTPAVIASHITLTDSSNNAVPFTVTQTDSNQGLMLTPNSPLATNTSYTVNWSNLGISGGQVAPLPHGIRFTTRPAYKGPKSEQVSGPFAVSQMLPSNPSFPLMDFSSLRLQFTQPVDPTTLVYGTTVSLLDASNKLVPATVLLTDRRLTVDPVNDLTAGQTYTLQLTNGIKSTFGDALTPGNFAAFKFVPQNSAPRVTQALQVPASPDPLHPIPSPLTGAAINDVPIQSTLLGNNSASQSSGNLYAQLAFVPHFPNATPITMRKGNIISGTNVDVKIAGHVAAGVSTGAISVAVISDANGYMVANPYSTLTTAPRLVYLTMDVSMSAANNTANGSLTQNIPHVEVVGTAIVKNGKFIMDAVGVVDLQVLGVDQASGVLSFHLEGYADQTTAPPQPVDTTAPSLQSWVPGSNTAAARPGDPIILNFTKALDPNTVELPGAVTLLANGSAAPLSFVHVDGTAVVVTPQAPLAHNVSYTLQLSQQIKDLAGNALDQAYSLGFSLPALVSPGTRSPFALTAYPGYPCATTGRNPASNQQGTCAGGMSSDDILPIPSLPASRSIDVRFSQSLMPASVALGAGCGSGSFRVEVLNSAGSCTSVVSGQLQVMAQEIKFTPATPWVIGQMYHYVLGSNGSTTSSTANCTGTGTLPSICGSNGLPLQTQILQQSPGATTPTGGGPSMDIWFTGGADTGSVFQALRNLPNSDVNANFVHDAGEADATANVGAPNGFSYPNASQIAFDATHTPPYDGLVGGANIGCPIGSPACPLNSFVFVNSALNAEVVGWDPTLSSGAGAVKVLIYPTMLVTTGFNLYAASSTALVTISNPIYSGPQIIRLRYGVNPNNSAVHDQPIVGTITSTANGPVLSATLDGYLDLPELNPQATALGFVPVPVTHNLHSYGLHIAVSGPVTFLADGRMVATLLNTAAVPIQVTTFAAPRIPGGDVFLAIPKGGMNVSGVSAPIKPQ